MDNIDEESVKEFNETQELVTHILKWLEERQNQSLFSKDEPPSQTIENLIKEVELCGSNGEFPWEVL